MPRTKKGRAPPKVFDELSETAKRRVRKRQRENGFRNIKALVDIVNTDRVKQGLPTRSRSYVSEMNKFLRDADERRKQHVEWLRQMKASPEDFIATAMAGIVGQMDIVFDLLMEQVKLPPTDDSEEIQRCISNQKMIASIWQSLSRALKDFKADARVDGVKFAQIIEETSQAIGQEARAEGLSDEVAAQFEEKFLGIARAKSQ